MPAIAPSLPPYLTAALDAVMHGQSQSDAAKRAAIISQTYRDGGTSSGIRTEADALAYAVARMPATYAAVAACINALVEIHPNFAPRSLIDCGAGPGTATFAAREAFASLATFTMLDANASLRTLARALGDASRTVPHYPLGDAATGLAAAPPADLVVASYMINEIPDAHRGALADALWRAAGDMLLVVEPGTPAGYARILDLRDRLIGQGAHVVAPCPHDFACPLTPPDWCHFSQRLPRSRAHKHLKGAELAFEDEKFSYVVLTRAEIVRPVARVLAKPDVTKVAVTTKLCTDEGTVAIDTAPKRDKAAFNVAKKSDWGDSILR
jgi:ribosomal protein RSM22 (predicted rRNA methylase)